MLSNLATRIQSPITGSTDGDLITAEGSVSFRSSQTAYADAARAWAYDPTTGVLDPNNTGFAWEDWIGTFYSTNEASYATAHCSGNTNDTILGGQGNEMLFGGDGNDLIRASVGDDRLSGGTGHDELHAGIGKQALMGGMGDDTIWGGLGAQFLLGDGGNDRLYAGAGNETLCGGSGRDTFTLSAASGRDVIADFQPGQDRIVLFSQSTSVTPMPADDLPRDLSSDHSGNTILSIGSYFQLMLNRLSLQQVTAHLTDYFKLA